MCESTHDGKQVPGHGMARSGDPVPLFDILAWRDPLTGHPLEPIVSARTPAGVPITGALRVAGTRYGYPIVDGVARLTPELAQTFQDWLRPLGLEAPSSDKDSSKAFQAAETVESFGWQWSWNAWMRSEADLQWRVAERFGVSAEFFTGKLVLDAGAGAGDQSGFLLAHGADVVSADLSGAIDVVARKFRMHPRWVGVQCDIAALPFAADTFDVVYCEGVIQHTADSAATVAALCRAARPQGHVLATHYSRPAPRGWWGRFKRRITAGYGEYLRGRAARMNRFKLLCLTGHLAALNYVPLLGWMLRRTGMVLYSPRMPDFKTTWTNTYDYYGQHAFQRVITPEQFWAWFEEQEGIRLLRKGEGLAMAQKEHPRI